jgi:hypothetical protein
MTHNKFVSTYLTPSTASTVATRRASEQDKRDARRDRGVDFHVNQATDKE